MINPEALVKRPIRERDLPPIATNIQVIQHFQERIEDIRREVKSPIRAPHFRHSNSLLHISGEEEYSLIGERFSTLGAMRIERGHGQELLFRVMTAYGFDQNISYPRLRYNYGDKKWLVIESADDTRWVEDITERPDGTTRELRIYPSQTTKGLIFERTRSFVTKTGETTDLWWNVVDEGPLLNIKNIFRRNPKPQISP